MKYAHTDNVNIPNAFSPRGVAETLCHVPETSRHRKCVGIIVVAGGNVRITGGINPGSSIVKGVKPSPFLTTNMSSYITFTTAHSHDTHQYRHIATKPNRSRGHVLEAFRRAVGAGGK